MAWGASLVTRLNANMAPRGHPAEQAWMARPGLDISTQTGLQILTKQIKAWATHAMPRKMSFRVRRYLANRGKTICPQHVLKCVWQELKRKYAPSRVDSEGFPSAPEVENPTLFATNYSNTAFLY